MAVQRRLQLATAFQEAARGVGEGQDLVKDRQNNDETLEELLERIRILNLRPQTGESALSTSFPEISSPLTKPGLFSGHAAAPYRGGVNEELIGRTLSRHPFRGDYRRRNF